MLPASLAPGLDAGAAWPPQAASATAPAATRLDPTTVRRVRVCSAMPGPSPWRDTSGSRCSYYRTTNRLACLAGAPTSWPWRRLQQLHDRFSRCGRLATLDDHARGAQMRAQISEGCRGLLRLCPFQVE